MKSCDHVASPLCYISFTAFKFCSIALEWKQRQCISDLLKEAIDQDYSYADFCDSAKLKSLHHGIKWSTLVNLIRKLHNENLRQFTLNELRKKYDPRTAHEICGELTHYCCMQKFGKSSGAFFTDNFVLNAMGFLFVISF